MEGLVVGRRDFEQALYITPWGLFSILHLFATNVPAIINILTSMF
jgi:hypothetical protein